MLRYAMLALLCPGGSAAAAHIVIVPGTGGTPAMRVIAAVGSDSSFRLSVDFTTGFIAQNAGDAVAALHSPSLDPSRSMPAFTKVSGGADGDGCGPWPLAPGPWPLFPTLCTPGCHGSSVRAGCARPKGLSPLPTGSRLHSASCSSKRTAGSS